MDSVLSLDDGSWPISDEGSCSLATNTTEEEFLQLNIRQPSIPPVFAEVHSESRSISPSKVADPRPGLPKLSHEGDSKTYQKLHVKNSTFVVTTLIIPKQESTSDSCQTTDEEEIFNVQDERSLFPLGWIHIMLPEAIAIVMAPTDTTRNHGIFHLSEPSGVSVIRNCQARGFHPHEEPSDGSPIYEHCSHVLMNTNLKFDVVDLRNK